MLPIDIKKHLAIFEMFAFTYAYC